jgi:sulfur-carrier protein adenylyltransferase/sulfurtransferase
MEIKEISVQELKSLYDSKEDFLLIDVRNPDEYEYCNLGGELISMSEITESYSKIPKDKKVIIHCHHGGRSRKVIAWLQDNFEYKNLFNLTGGIHAWSTEVDTNVPIY